jgi:hypothetical protein
MKTKFNLKEKIVVIRMTIARKMRCPGYAARMEEKGNANICYLWENQKVN